MARLNAQARRAIREAGFTLAEFARMNGYTDGKWGGDVCGCTDAGRCANGFHHIGVDDCGCLPVLLDRAVAWREAVREPDRVELPAVIGSARWVDVSTPGVLATVSVTGGFPGRTAEQSTVRIEPREGWTATVTEHGGRIEIRVVKAAPPADEKETGHG